MSGFLSKVRAGYEVQAAGFKVTTGNIDRLMWRTTARDPKATSNGQYGKNVHITAITAKQLSTVYHIGSLKRPSKKSFSLEGAGVSVSVDPLAWIKIVKLGGHDVWKLEKANPKFLMWSKTNDKKALTWAVQNAWLVAAIRYQTSFYSDEMEDEMMTDHDTREEAEKEAFDGEVAEIKSYKLGQKGMEYWKKTFSSKPSNSIAIALAIVWYAEAHNFDGVWWQETYDPSSFSAPRGVIFDITKWKKTKLKEGEYSDYHSD